MARTKEELAAYNREYRQRNHERVVAKNRAWYAEHRETEVARGAERSRARKERLGEDYTEARRIERNMRIARRAGCSEDEAWQVAMQAEYERGLNGDSALRGGRFQALIAEHLALRETFTRLACRQWEPVKGDTAVVMDDGYDLDDEEVA